MKFNPGFLGLSDGKSADEINLSWFEHEGGMLPGQYRVDVMLNGEYVDTDVFTFKSSASHPGRLYACVSEERYSQWGITLPDTGTVSPSGKEGETCGEGIAGLIPGATERLNFSESQLVLSVPQAYLAPPGWLNTPSRLWDEGVPAAMVNYTVSGSSQENGGQAYDSQYLSLNTALSLKGWRLRQDSNWSRSKGSSGRWQALNTWLSHDYAWGQGGQLTLGQTSTDGSIFDSFPFEGLALSSDDGMIQPLLASFSPVFSGVAYSQAQVTVRQNGVVVYQKNVPAGPFELRDVPQLYSGDVVLEVREADGTVHRTLQTAASVPVLQREGRMRYSLVAGRYRQQDNASGTPSPNLI
ncbi:fimbrial biogenesis outer membrane usher protein, partial [Salmonella enterica]|nr:fimbrial biogenesis outer membrane usher protein [Salmonella enterica]